MKKEYRNLRWQKYMMLSVLLLGIVTLVVWIGTRHGEVKSVMSAQDQIHAQGAQNQVSTEDLFAKKHPEKAVETVIARSVVPQRELTQKEQRLASTFTSDRHDSQEAEWVVEAYFPKLYQLSLLQSKAIRSTDDSEFQTSYLTSEEFLEDIRTITLGVDDFHASNVGEYARLYALQSLSLALKQNHQPLKDELGSLLVKAMGTFPENDLGEGLRNSFVIDRIQYFGLLQKYFPEKLGQLNFNELPPATRQAITSVQKNPEKYKSLMEI
jgi:hypothetical protein